MNMAKPSAKDIEAGEELLQVLLALDEDNRFGGASLSEAPEFFSILDAEPFDSENEAHLLSLYNKLMLLMDKNPGFYMRIISGMCHVIMYDKNEIVDPDSRIIDLHPRFKQMENDLQRETQAARYWNGRYHEVNAERDRLHNALVDYDTYLKNFVAVHNEHA